MRLEPYVTDSEGLKGNSHAKFSKFSVTEMRQLRSGFLILLGQLSIRLRIPGMGEPGGLPSVGSHRAGQD